MAKKKGMPRSAGKSLAKRPVEELQRVIRSVLATLGPIGAVLEFQIFDRINARSRERSEAFIRSLSRQVRRLVRGRKNYIRQEFLDTDEFRFILTEVLQRVEREHREEKIRCFHGILINAMYKDPRIVFDRKTFFLQVLDVLTTDHILALRFFHRRYLRDGDKAMLCVPEIWDALEAHDEATRNYIYSGLDTMANRQLLVVGQIPLRRRRVEEKLEFHEIVKNEQSFAISDLGLEFVEFVTIPDSL